MTKRESPFDPVRLGVRAFHFGRGPKIHAAKLIVGLSEVPEHVRLACGLSGSPANRQFRVIETSDPITCLTCIHAIGLSVSVPPPAADLDSSTVESASCEASDA